MFCCFKPKYYTSGVSLNSKPSTECNIENISVSVTDRNTLYDPNEWLNTVNKTIDVKDTMPFIPPIEKGIVVKVYDGDTITIVSKLPYPDSPLYRFSVRLNGIDCPEIKGKDKNEKECAQLAKQEMTELVFNKVVTLKNVDTEKFYSQRAFFTKNSTISSKEIPTCLAIFGTNEVAVKPGCVLVSSK